jgi:hypothetical protein
MEDENHNDGGYDVNALELETKSHGGDDYDDDP